MAMEHLVWCNCEMAPQFETSNATAESKTDLWKEGWKVQRHHESWNIIESMLGAKVNRSRKHGGQRASCPQISQFVTSAQAYSGTQLRLQA